MHRSSSGEHQLNWCKRAEDFVSKILCHHLFWKELKRRWLVQGNHSLWKGREWGCGLGTTISFWEDLRTALGIGWESCEVSIYCLHFIREETKSQIGLSVANRLCYTGPWGCTPFCRQRRKMSVVFHFCSSYLKTVGTYLKSTVHQERDPTSFEEEGKTSRMFEVTFVMPNWHAHKPNWRFLSAQLHWAEVSEGRLCSVFLRWATESLQNSPQLTDLFLTGLSLPWELIPAIVYLSIHWHILWNINLFLYCTSFGHLSCIILCLFPEWYFLNWIMARTLKKLI